jgi:superfamily II DNA or RNA helicase
MIFQSADEAAAYIQQQLEKGLICEQRFGLEGIEVTCRLNVGPTNSIRRGNARSDMLPPNQNTLFNIPEPENRIIKQETFENNETMNLPHELRDYQQQAVNFALHHRRSIIEIPTGRGKTLISLGIVNEILQEHPSRRVLVVVPTTVLLSQWVNDGFGESGLTATSVFGGAKQWGKYTVTTYQSAIRNLDHVKSYDIVIFDEVHHLFADEYRNILYALLPVDAYMIGLTATVREYGEGRLIQDKYFPDRFTKNMEEFQEGNSKIPLQIFRVPVQFSDEERLMYDDYQATIKKANRALGPVPEWRKYFNSSDPTLRNMAYGAMHAYAEVKKLLTEAPEKIDKILEIIKSSTGQFVIFADTIDSIKDIEHILRENGITEGSIYSGISEMKRRKIIDGLKNKEIQVLVGGNAISEGMDIPNIDNAILSSLLVKSSRVYVQRVGRVLRPRAGKRVKIYLVYVDNTLEETNAKGVYDILGEEYD